MLKHLELEHNEQDYVHKSRLSNAHMLKQKQKQNKR